MIKFIVSNFWVPLCKAILQKAVGALEDTVIEIVYSLKTADLSDNDKRTEAFRQIKEIAIKRGIELKDNAIQDAITKAIELLKARAA